MEGRKRRLDILRATIRKANEEGREIDKEKLEKALGVPVVHTCALTGEGIKELVDRLPEAKALRMHVFSDTQRWKKIGEIVEKVQKLTHRPHTLLLRIPRRGL